MSIKIIPTEQMLEIMSAMASEGKTRREIATKMGISHGTLATWVLSEEFPEVRQRYLAAKQAYANDLAEDIMRQASAPLHENPKLANAEVQRRKLIVDTSRWVASKLLPKVYGDNLHINHAHSGKIELSPLAQLRKLETKPPASTVIEAEVVGGASITEDDCF